MILNGEKWQAARDSCKDGLAKQPFRVKLSNDTAEEWLKFCEITRTRRKQANENLIFWLTQSKLILCEIQADCKRTAAGSSQEETIGQKKLRRRNEWKPFPKFSENKKFGHNNKETRNSQCFKYDLNDRRKLGIVYGLANCIEPGINSGNLCIFFSSAATL